MRKFFKELKEIFEIKESTPSFIVSGLMGCAVSAVLIAVRLIAFYFF